MLKLDQEFLKACGLEALDQADMQSLLVELWSDLESRVGYALFEALTDEEQNSLQDLYDRGATDEEAFAWLSSVLPDYKEAVDAALEDLKAELVQKAPSILRAAG